MIRHRRPSSDLATGSASISKPRAAPRQGPTGDNPAMIKKASSKRWMREHITDPFVKQAQKDGYRSRAAYKLLEIAQKDRLFRPGAVVFDLGAAPGGWSQVAAKAVGATGRVFAIDLLQVQPVPGVVVLRGDFVEPETRAGLLELVPDGADLVLSDMAPNVSGIADRDQQLSHELAQIAVDFAVESLRPGGSVLLKIFQSERVDKLRAEMCELFARVSVRKPEASRGRSAEVFLLGASRLGGAWCAPDAGRSDRSPWNRSCGIS
jgi:23S rRNA (uridine2552-2'-O)-methyltransferase